MELVFFVILLLIGGLLQAGGKKKQRQRRLPQTQAPAGEEIDLLAEFRKAMDQLKAEREPKRLPPKAPQSAADVRAAEPARHAPAPVGRWPAEGRMAQPRKRASDPGSFQGVRGERVVVDLDDEAEAVIQQRLEWVRQHSGALTEADHRAFDARIRKQKPAARKGSTRPDAAQLRQLLIWQEVLGKPVSLREDER